MRPSARLRYEPFAPRHAPSLLTLFRDAHMRRYLLDDTLVDRDWVAAEIQASAERFSTGSLGLWLARLRHSGVPIGFVGFRPFFEPPVLQLLYGLLPAYTHQGLASEMAAAAIDHGFAHRLTRIRASVDEPNTASVRVLERLGFRRVGEEPGVHERQLHFELSRSAWYTRLSPELAALLDAYPPQVRRLVLTARRRLRALVPQAKERVRRGWRLLGFSAPHYFAYVAPLADHVRVGFEHGVLLADPEGLLEGSGTQVRYASIWSQADLRRPGFAALVLQAAGARPASKLPGSRRNRQVTRESKGMLVETGSGRSGKKQDAHRSPRRRR